MINVSSISNSFRRGHNLNRDFGIFEVDIRSFLVNEKNKLDYYCYGCDLYEEHGENGKTCVLIEKRRSLCRLRKNNRVVSFNLTNETREALLALAETMLVAKQQTPIQKYVPRTRLTRFFQFFVRFGSKIKGRLAMNKRKGTQAEGLSLIHI